MLTGRSKPEIFKRVYVENGGTKPEMFKGVWVESGGTKPEICKGAWVSISTETLGNNIKGMSCLSVSCRVVVNLSMPLASMLPSHPELILLSSGETLGFNSNNLALPALICLACPDRYSTLVALCTPGSFSSMTRSSP